jgi:hypothetical protein
MTRMKKKTAAQLDAEIAAELARKAKNNPKGHQYRIAPKHWEVIAVLPDGNGLVGKSGFRQTCGHRHASADEATMCPWTPDPWPEQCDLLVRQFRTPDKRTMPEQGKLFG